MTATRPNNGAARMSHFIARVAGTPVGSALGVPCIILEADSSIPILIIYFIKIGKSALRNLTL